MALRKQEERKDKRLVSKIIRRCPDAVVIKRWVSCPRIKNHEVVSAGSGHCFITSEKTLFFEFQSFALEGKELLLLYKHGF